MKQAIFKDFCSIAYDQAGIFLTEGKESLVEARVGKRLRALGLGSEEAYLKLLRGDTTGQELVSFLDSITTNFTHFMRESEHFDDLANMVPRGALPPHCHFRIWCAAASTGEEPYTIIITLLGALAGRELDFKMLATDISTKVLHKAIEGCYDETKVAPLTKAERTKYLLKVNGSYRVRPEVKQYITYRRLNLAKPPFPMTGPFDVVFCRNVMIYFDRAVRQGLISEVERLLAPGGILFIGHSETLAGIKTELKSLRPSVYRKPGPATIWHEDPS